MSKPVFYWAGKPVSCVKFLSRTPQGEYRYRIAFADGSDAEVDVGEGTMLELSDGPRCPAPRTNSLSEDDATRNEFPMFDGLIAYFPNALAYVASISKIGNDQHNPGEPMHWARGKSTDHLNKAVRHLVDAGGIDARGVRHTGRAAWRILAELQEELEREEGVPMSRGSRPAE